MWTEDLLENQVFSEESFQESATALRTWWREKRELDYTPSVNEVLRCKLYIGCEIAAFKISKTHPQIKAIVSLHSQGPTKCGYQRFDGITYHHVSIQDDPSANLLKFLHECCDFIHNHDGPVFVHCVAGVSRSASVCIAYLIKYHLMTADQAFAVVHCARPIIRPNNGFVQQLKYFESEMIK